MCKLEAPIKWYEYEEPTGLEIPGRRQVRRLTSSGIPYCVWTDIMPYLGDTVTDCSIYLYPSRDDADNSSPCGGCGFVVGIQSAINPIWWYEYAITNKHVVFDNNSPVIRINKEAGGVDILDLKKSDWTKHPDGDDLAICEVDVGDAHKFLWVGLNYLLDKSRLLDLGIGHGNDCYLVGRLVGEDGKERNIPTVRYGNIAQMPEEPTAWLGHLQERFLVEIRTITGFSGSPVFVRRDPMRNVRYMTSEQWEYLLGIDCGLINRRTRVKVPNKSRPSKEADDTEGRYVNLNTGMAIVIPSWRIHGLLNHPKIAAAREAHEQKLRDERDASAVEPASE